MRKMPEANGHEVVQEARTPRVPNRAGGGLAPAFGSWYEM